MDIINLIISMIHCTGDFNVSGSKPFIFSSLHFLQCRLAAKFWPVDTTTYDIISLQKQHLTVASSPITVCPSQMRLSLSASVVVF